MDDAGAVALSSAEWPYLKDLRLDGNELRSVAPLVAAGWRFLEKLDLSGNILGDDGAAMLALGAIAWPRLQTLILDGTGFGDEGLAELARGKFPCLQELDLSQSGFGPVGLTALAANDWPNLRHLRLQGNEDIPGVQMELAGVVALAAKFPCLQTLDLSDNNLGHMGAVALARATWPSLTELRIGWNDLSAVAISVFVALAAAKWTHLQTLDVGDDGVDMPLESRDVLAVMAAAQWPRLQITYGM